MLTATQVFNHLNEHAEKFGYGALTQEERRFVARYRRLHVRTGERINPNKQPVIEQRTWSGASVTSRPKRRRTARAKTWVDKSVATWTKPAAQPKQGVDSESLLAAMPDIYTRSNKEQVVCR